MGRLELSTGGASQSNFRELDDVFLQTQTRIWLGEVLNMRLDHQIQISDLLADGDLLCEVSRVVWNMLSVKYAELRHLKYKPTGSRRSSGRYMPYSNVDSFLMICKILGLNGIDLFSPSDVVEKRNIRKVCICLRALSNKLRSKQLNVPNFDMVTYAVSMPKDMVGGIRRSLETSKSSISSSSSYNSYKDQRPVLGQRKLTQVCDRNYDSCSEGSDEAESKYMGEESYCSSSNKFNESDINQHQSESPFSHCTRNDHSPDSISCSDIRNDDAKDILDSNLARLDHIDLSMEHNESMGDSTYDNEVEGNYICDYLAFSDSIIGGCGDNTPVLLDGEENMLNVFRGIDSSQRRSYQGKRISDDIEDAEVSSTASVSSVLGRALDLEFDDHFYIDGSLIEDTHTALLVEKVEEGPSSQGANEPSVTMERSGINQSSIVPTSSHEASQAMEEKCPFSTLDGSNDASVLQSSEIPNEDMDNNLLAENASDGKDGKDHGWPLLKTVASGTAIVGLLFLLLHLSRRERGKTGIRKLVQNKFKGRQISSREGARIYPAEKLKFKT